MLKTFVLNYLLRYLRSFRQQFLEHRKHRVLWTIGLIIGFRCLCHFLPTSVQPFIKALFFL